jgi:hypothetical protein
MSLRTIFAGDRVPRWVTQAPGFQALHDQTTDELVARRTVAEVYLKQANAEDATLSDRYFQGPRRKLRPQTANAVLTALGTDTCTTPGATSRASSRAASNVSASNAASGDLPHNTKNENEPGAEHHSDDDGSPLADKVRSAAIAQQGVLRVG